MRALAKVTFCGVALAIIRKVGYWGAETTDGEAPPEDEGLNSCIALD
ncbi:hypothetical protein [Allocoleopsis sp.]